MSDLRSAPQGPDDLLSAWLSRQFGGGRNAASQAQKITNLLDLTPLGIPQAMYSAGQMMGGGAQNFNQSPGAGAAKIGAGLGIAALGMIPGGRTLDDELANAASQGVIAYHGSPYEFDKFDASKIGTGEGNQSFGHGLYFADNEKVAKKYRDMLGDRPTATPLIPRQDWNSLSDIHGEVISNIDNQLENAIIDEKPSPTWSDLRHGVGQKFVGNDRDDALAAFDDLNNRYGWQGVFDPRPGHMYQVRINADPNSFLDWDKPLGQQPQVAANLAAIDNPVSQAWQTNGAWPNVTGQSFYKNLASGLTNGAVQSGATKSASDVLQSAGVTGIKYLDGGSRGAGQGTSNYVVFNPNIVDILKRYMAPVAATGGLLGAGYAASQPQSQQTY